MVESVQEKKGHGKLNLTPNLLLNWISCHKKNADCKKINTKNPKNVLKKGKKYTHTHTHTQQITIICENHP